MSTNQNVSVALLNLKSAYFFFLFGIVSFAKYIGIICTQYTVFMRLFNTY